MGQKLWGISPSNTNKPHWLTAKQAENCYATKSGWVLKYSSGIIETLVAIAGLENKLGPASVTDVKWKETSVATSATGTLYVDFDEQLAVTGTPTLVLQGGSPVATVGLTAGGSGYTEATVVITGDGFGATATATVVAGAVTAVTLTSAGTGYRNISIQIVGDGTGALADISLGAQLSVTASYVSLEGANNSMLFTFTAPANPDTLQVITQTISLNGGTVTELANSSINANLAIPAFSLPVGLPVTA